MRQMKFIKETRVTYKYTGSKHPEFSSSSKPSSTSEKRMTEMRSNPTRLVVDVAGFPSWGSSATLTDSLPLKVWSRSISVSVNSDQHRRKHSECCCYSRMWHDFVLHFAMAVFGHRRMNSTNM